MHFHVLGLGPIGSLLSHHLRRAIPEIHPITLIHRNPGQAREALLRGSTISVETNGITTAATGFRSEIFEGLDATTEPGLRVDKSHTPESRPINSLFITTKAQETLPAIRRLRSRISNHSTIVLLQNGMGVYEELVHKVFRDPQQRPHFILASNTHGAFLKSFYNVVHTGIGAIQFGIIPDPEKRDFESGFNDPNVEISERRARIADITTPEDPKFLQYKSLRDTVAALSLLEPLNISWTPISQIQLVMRRKLVVNAVINPLTAIMGCRNGDIFTTDYADRIARRVCQEAADVFAAQVRRETQTWWDNLAEQGYDMESVTLGRIPRALMRVSLEEEVKRVTELTRGNISSMLSDIRRGRGTEIDYINGYLLGLGSTYRVEMPATATLLNLVKMRSAIPLDQML
ncbi:ketopantoate reductase-like protein [Crucibulum laeve]|uniref:2-dehydropantoate 2-reductase n=1 Tax=Crucibulum laeve TaxID=68775 RepID=A0A5C3LVH5_9AGAR|nr:ketopantoate reductase-like protein [Crucibulum laeve]